MSFEFITLKPAWPVSADMSGNNFHAAVLGATGIALAGAGVGILGIIRIEDGEPIPNTLGDACNVACEGLVRCEAGAVIAFGVEVGVDATGGVTTLAAGRAVGYATEAAAAAGDLILVKIY